MRLVGRGEAALFDPAPHSPYGSVREQVLQSMAGSPYLADEIAPRLDAGVPVTARISEITGGSIKNLGVDIEISKYRMHRNK